MLVAICWAAACDTGSPDAGAMAGASSAGSAGGGLGGAAGNAGTTNAGLSGQSTGGANAAAGKSGSGLGGSSLGGNGSGSGGGAGASSAAGASGKGCAGKDYLICEDFESTADGEIPTGWTRGGPTDKVGVASDAFASGQKSLKVGPTLNGERRIKRSGATLGAAHWGRIHFKVQLPVTDNFVHSTLVAASGMGPTQGPLEVRLFDTVKAAKADTPGWCSDKQVTTNCYQLLYNVQPENFGEFGKGGPYSWSFDDAWHCAEWHLDSTAQSYELFYDSERIDDVSFSNGAGNFDNSEIPSVLSEIRVGWNNYQGADPGFTAWIDDVVFDDQRIGCE